MAPGRWQDGGRPAPPTPALRNGRSSTSPTFCVRPITCHFDGQDQNLLAGRRERKTVDDGWPRSPPELLRERPPWRGTRIYPQSAQQCPGWDTRHHLRRDIRSPAQHGLHTHHVVKPAHNCCVSGCRRENGGLRGAPPAGERGAGPLESPPPGRHPGESRPLGQDTDGLGPMSCVTLDR